MDENAKAVPIPAGRWLALIVAAVILAEGIWGMLVSITRSLLVPLVARITGGDSQSALYLGKGDINIPDLFGSILQVCLAGIVFLLIKSWASSRPRAKAPRTVKIGKPVSASLSVTPQTVAAAAQATAASAVPPSQPSSQPEVRTSPHAAAPSVPPQPMAKADEPQKAKEVYYNIVGEPISPAEDE